MHFSPHILLLEKKSHLYSCTGNNIYGLDVREALIRLKKEGGDALSAYILMQRIFPKESLANLVRGGVCHEALTVSELGIYGAYLRYNQCLKHKVQALLLLIRCFFF